VCEEGDVVALPPRVVALPIRVALAVTYERSEFMDKECEDCSWNECSGRDLVLGVWC
jgi:hypothetical protein